MKILSMTATFGKLQNETLTFSAEENLNILCRPNEWGKSTWCAFLTTMLYGLETGKKTEKAHKNRYAPWAGGTMRGRMDILWQGRHITIERKEKSRTPMGDFSAYETDSGLPVPELTAANCGQVLLGVERSVFQRSCLISLADLPVTEDPALVRRLNSLVTTGDESTASDELEKNLEELQKECRSKRNTGSLPQAETLQRELEGKLQQLQQVQLQTQELQRQCRSLEAFAQQLENHKATLAYEAAREHQGRTEKAMQDLADARHALQQQEKALQASVSPEQARLLLQQAKQLQQQQAAADMEARLLPPLPQPPEQGCDADPEQLLSQAQQDLQQLQALERAKKRNGLFLGIYAALSVCLLGLLLIPGTEILVGAAIALGGIAVLILCFLRTKRIQTAIEALYDRHPGLHPGKWLVEAQKYAADYYAYTRALADAQALRQDHDLRKEQLHAALLAFTQGNHLDTLMEQWEQTLQAHQHLEQLRQQLHWAQEYAQQLQQLQPAVQPPAQPDPLQYTPAETEELLSSTASQLQTLHRQLSVLQDRAAHLGSRQPLQAQLEATTLRVRQLSAIYDAADLALQTLAQAREALQQRFSPRITQQARDIFAQLTAGKYDRLRLSKDLSLEAGTHSESVLRPAWNRSDGTVDQLYLALRLAVARELTPQAPMILDDAFARFDDTRLRSAMEILKEEAQNRQVILFSCQDRESKLL